jgi:hypothetical protein
MEKRTVRKAAILALFGGYFGGRAALEGGAAMNQNSLQRDAHLPNDRALS